VDGKKALLNGRMLIKLTGAILQVGEWLFY